MEGEVNNTTALLLKRDRYAEVKNMVKDVTKGTFIAINCGRDTQGFCYWLGKAVKAPYKAVHDWTDYKAMFF